MKLIEKNPRGTIAISPSAIGTARTCLRKWGYRYIARRPQKPSPYKDFGVKVHKIFEDYYTNGTWQSDDSAEHKCAAAMREHLPEYLTDKFFTEAKVYIYCGSGIYMVGISDLQALGKSRLFDFKTTSDLKYALSAEALASDPAAVVYSQAYRLRFGRYPELRWVYGQRNGRKSRLVRAWAKMSLWPSIVDEASRLTSLWEDKVDPESLECSTEGCGAYGGCDYIETCTVSNLERLKSIIAKGEAF